MKLVEMRPPTFIDPPEAWTSPGVSTAERRIGSRPYLFVAVSRFGSLGYFVGVATVRSIQVTRSGAGPSDAALVIAARAGEAWASEALFRRHAPMVNGLAFRVMGRDSDVDDLVQETFAQAFTSLARLAEPQAFSAWLGAILVRTASKIIRHRRILARLGFSRDALAIDLDSLIGPSVPADHAAELKRIYLLVADLPADLRVALVLRRVEELPLEEIAALLDCSLATAKRRIIRAEELLRQRFEGGTDP